MYNVPGCTEINENSSVLSYAMEFKKKGLVIQYSKNAFFYLRFQLMFPLMSPDTLTALIFQLAAQDFLIFPTVKSEKLLFTLVPGSAQQGIWKLLPYLYSDGLHQRTFPCMSGAIRTHSMRMLCIAAAPAFPLVAPQEVLFGFSHTLCKMIKGHWSVKNASFLLKA